MRKMAVVVVLTLGVAVGAVASRTRPAARTCSAREATSEAEGAAAPQRCTVLTVSKGDRVFFAGNDDFINPDSYYWVDPGGPRGYGAIWIGERDNVQQGVNEKGLAYDANGLPRVVANPHAERAPVSGGYSSYPIHILRECATVEEVIVWVNTHQWHSYMHDQMHFADATGDAVIISAGPDGELVLTRKPRGSGYLVSTNFNVANTANSYGYPCQRYETAERLLGALLGKEGDLSSADAAGVLDAVHVAGANSWTIESLVADLPNGIVYLYYFHQFDKPVVLRVADELANPHPEGPLSRLFPEDVQQEAARRYHQLQARAAVCRRVGEVWLALAIASLLAFVVLSLKRRRGWLFWMPVVAISGPLGLAVWGLAGRASGGASWRAALVEALGGVVPTIAAFVGMLAVIVLLLLGAGPVWLQVSFLLGLPLAVGLIAFQAPLLALGTKRSPIRILSGRLPQAWVVANLGLAGTNMLAAPLASQSLRTCPIMPASPWTVLAWWAVADLGATVGLLLVFAYESWAVRRGFRAWSVLVSGEGEVVSPSWRRLWWWLLLSYVVLFSGIVGSVFVQKLLPA